MSETPQYLYTYNHDYHHEELCMLEQRQLFNLEGKNNLLFSPVKIDPSISPFLKNRIKIATSNEDYDILINQIKALKIKMEGFKAEYIILNNDLSERAERYKKLRDIGHCIEGFPNFENPTTTYAICKHEGTWYFGTLLKQKKNWLAHNEKPHSFSSSIEIRIAKTLVNLASKGDKKTTILDGCCGVGTIILEASYSGFNIEGNDINPKTHQHALLNIKHFNYNAKVSNLDMCELSKKYDSIILDLPYNLYSFSERETIEKIINKASQLAQRLIIVSTHDIKLAIQQAGFIIKDTCKVDKRGNLNFIRTIWVCEKSLQ